MKPTDHLNMLKNRNNHAVLQAMKYGGEARQVKTNDWDGFRPRFFCWGFVGDLSIKYGGLKWDIHGDIYWDMDCIRTRLQTWEQSSSSFNSQQQLAVALMGNTSNGTYNELVGDGAVRRLVLA